MIEMTKLEKNKKIVTDDLDNNTEFTKDKWGNYIFNDDNTLRYKPKKSVLRKEKKINKRWIYMWSGYYKDIAPRLNKK